MTDEREVILLTGGSGFVGARIRKAFGERFRILELPRETIRGCDGDAIRRAMEENAVRCILHTAAMADVGECERDPEGSYRANVCLPATLAKAAAAAGAKLISFSSDQVYVGEKERGPFTEARPVTPTNVYGRHKLEAEQRILELAPDSVCLRATWMYDLPGRGLPLRGNLPMNLLRAALEGRQSAFSEADLRGVTYVWQAVDNLLPAMHAPGGVYNFGSENTVGMFTTACAFAAALHIHPAIIRDENRAPRSLLMDGGKARTAGIVFDDTLAGIRRCTAEYGIG